MTSPVALTFQLVEYLLSPKHFLKIFVSI